MIYPIIIIAAAGAIISGILESEWIKARIAEGDKRELPHGILALVRLGVGIIVVGMFAASWWTLIPMALAFAPLHRATLNLRRGKGLFYLGMGNVYDTAWIGLALFTTFTTWGARTIIERAAMYAYCFEVGLLSIFLLW